MFPYFKVSDAPLTRGQEIGKRNLKKQMSVLFLYLFVLQSQLIQFLKKSYDYQRFSSIASLLFPIKIYRLNIFSRKNLFY